MQKRTKSLKTPLAICYLLGSYKSHSRAGRAYQKCLRDSGMTLTDDPGMADTVIIHDDLHNFPRYFQRFPVLYDKYLIAYAVWEPSSLPTPYARVLQAADEIWTSSEHCRAIFSEVSPKVSIIPHVVEEPFSNAEADRLLLRTLGLTGDGFFFYMIGRWEERKNIAAAVRAFRAAFPDGGADLVIKTTDSTPSEFRNTPGIACFEGYTADALVGALHRCGKCLVSTHCAEGWGLCLSDAMAHGNLVIATGYSGNMQYMTSANSLPVSFRIEPIRNPLERLQFNFEPSSTEPKWAYVDEDDLKTKMLQAFHNWSELEPLRRTARSDILKFSADHVGQMMVERLNNIPGKTPSKSRHGVGWRMFAIQERDDRRPLAFMHIPKTAGSALMKGIADSLPGRRVVRGFDTLFFGDFRGYSSLSPNIAQDVHANIQDMPAADLIMGHFSLSTLSNRYPDAQCITFLREPTGRLLSHWVYWRGLSENQLALWGEWANSLASARGNLKDFLSNPEAACQIDNVAVRMLLSPYPGLKESDFIEPHAGEQLLRAALSSLGGLAYTDIIENPDYLLAFQNWLGVGFIAQRVNETLPVPPALRLSLDEELDDVTIKLLELRTRLDLRLWIKLAADRMPRVDLERWRSSILQHSLKRFERLLAP